MRPDADTSWFNFACQGGDFGVYSFTGQEEVCKPYEFTIELVSKSDSEDILGLLGTPAYLSIKDRSGEKRLVHGLIREMEQLHTANIFTHYRCILVPRLWFLDQITDHRIFQHLSVVDIIQKILKEQGFTNDASSFKLSAKYDEREYCVQYGETDLHFISRLCEEEGIYFYFEHSENGHTLCFSDREGGPKISGESDIRYYQGSGHIADTSVISRLKFNEGINSNAAAYREWNFTQPRLSLSVKEEETDTKKAPVPQGMLLEQYRYPHIYDMRDPGSRYAKLQVLRQLTYAKWIECESDVSRYLPDSVFNVNQYPRDEVNTGWWVAKILHEGEQPQVLEHEAPSDRGLKYKSTVTAIPETTRFIPALEHPKALIQGDQTAIVTGPSGEEIYPDEYGRVKVQFFWDREGNYDDKTTCWIRASNGWAGGQYGIMAVPRVGHEVIVSFINGDPDRPIITGRVYHKLNMPPYELPANKTRTVFKSMSTPGKEHETRGFNEFRVEDRAGEEEIYVHAEKDINTYTKHDWKEHILNDRHRTVGKMSYTWVKEEDHLIVDQPRKVELRSDAHLTVKNDSHTEYCTKWLVKTGEEVHISAGDKVVIDAGSDLTIKGGGAFIRLTPAGVVIKGGGGMVKINEGGSPGSGSDAAPVTPTEAKPTDAGTAPGGGDMAKPMPPEREKV